MNPTTKDTIFTGAFLTPFSFLIGGPAGVACTGLLTGLIAAEKEKEANDLINKNNEIHTPKIIDYETANKYISELRKRDDTIIVNRQNYYVSRTYEWIHMNNPTEGIIQIQKKEPDSEKIEKRLWLYRNPIAFVDAMEKDKRFNIKVYNMLQSGADLNVMYAPENQDYFVAYTISSK